MYVFQDFDFENEIVAIRQGMMQTEGAHCKKLKL